MSSTIHQKSTVVSKQQPKPYKQIPKLRGLRGSFLGLLLDGGPRFLHEHCSKLHEKLGPIYRDKLGPNEMVFVYEPEMIRKVSANEGAYPRHNVPEAWQLFNEANGIRRGLFFESGEKWLKLRKPMNRVLLSDIENINSFDSNINEITKSFFDTIELNNNQTKHSAVNTSAVKGKILVNDLKMKLCKWSIETTCAMLFGKRIGNNVESESECLVESVSEMFKLTSKFQVMPARLARKLNLKSWIKFEQTSARMLKIAKTIADDSIECVRNTKDSKSLIKLLLNYLSPEEVSASSSDLIIAAADTTSNSLQWMLYALGRDEALQEQAFGELRQLTKAMFPNATDLKQAAFLQGFIKEILRLYPTAPFLARTLDKDLELEGYIVPANTTIIFSLFHSSRCSKYFESPLQIRPERWYRTNDKTSGCPVRGADKLREGLARSSFASLPFGVGARSCIGKRMAELQIRLLMASFIKNFEISLPEKQKDIKIELDMIIVPSEPIELLLSRRNNSE